jgi:hypothetical protein
LNSEELDVFMGLNQEITKLENELSVLALEFGGIDNIPLVKYNFKFLNF